MKITLLLIGTRKGQPPFVHIRMESADGMKPADQEKVFNYINLNSPILGLEYTLRGDGSITYSAANNHLRSGTVSDMRVVFRNALHEI